MRMSEWYEAPFHAHDMHSGDFCSPADRTRVYFVLLLFFFLFSPQPGETVRNDSDDEREAISKIDAKITQYDPTYNFG